MPSKPQLATAAAANTKVVRQWDEYVSEATRDVEPWTQALPDGEVVEVPCPSSDAMEALGAAQRTGDTVAMVIAVFGPDIAPKILDATAKLPFYVRMRLINEVAMHYGMKAANLPES